MSTLERTVEKVAVRRTNAADDSIGLSAHTIAYEMYAGGGSADHAVGARAGGFWCIPRVKFAIRGLLECTFLCLLATVLLNTSHRSLGLTESALYLCAPPPGHPFSNRARSQAPLPPSHTHPTAHTHPLALPLVW